MNNKKSISLDETLMKQIFPFRASKAQARMIQIAEAAIQSYAEIGYTQTTFEKIAEVCKISRPLIRHYFDTREEIFEFSIRYIRANFQKLAVDYISQAASTEDKLARYVQSTFRWVEECPSHIRVWLYYLHYCSILPDLREQNTEFVNIGHDRITALLQLGVDEGVFKIKNLRTAAKQIQVVISGALVSCVSENLYQPIAEFEADTIELCKKIAGVTR